MWYPASRSRKGYDGMARSHTAPYPASRSRKGYDGMARSHTAPWRMAPSPVCQK